MLGLGWTNKYNLFPPLCWKQPGEEPMVLLSSSSVLWQAALHSEISMLFLFPCVPATELHFFAHVAGDDTSSTTWKRKCSSKRVKKILWNEPLKYAKEDPCAEHALAVNTALWFIGCNKSLRRDWLRCSKLCSFVGSGLRVTSLNPDHRLHPWGASGQGSPCMPWVH